VAGTSSEVVSCAAAIEGSTATADEHAMTRAVSRSGVQRGEIDLTDI
jgi:hypothetical protein